MENDGPYAFFSQEIHEMNDANLINVEERRQQLNSKNNFLASISSFLAAIESLSICFGKEKESK